MLINILEQSLLFFPLGLGLYISYAILKTADLTSDGSFLIGAVLFGICVKLGLNPLIGMGVSFVGGAFCGALASFLHTNFKLHPLIAGILLVFILNTVSLKILGKPNLCLLEYPSAFSVLGLSKIALLLILSSGLFISLAGLLSSRIGLILKGIGNSPVLVSLFGENSFFYRAVGLGLANGLAGLSGSLTAQVNGYVDISMGVGIVLIALGTIVIGCQIRKLIHFFSSFEKIVNLFCCFIGILVYFFLMHLLLAIGLDPIYLRLAIGLTLIIFLTLTQREQMGAAV